MASFWWVVATRPRRACWWGRSVWTCRRSICPPVRCCAVIGTDKCSAAAAMFGNTGPRNAPGESVTANGQRSRTASRVRRVIAWRWALLRRWRRSPRRWEWPCRVPLQFPRSTPIIREWPARVDGASSRWFGTIWSPATFSTWPHLKMRSRLTWQLEDRQTRSSIWSRSRGAWELSLTWRRLTTFRSARRWLRIFGLRANTWWRTFTMPAA